MKCEYCDNEIKIGTAQCDRCGAFVEKKSKASKPDAESMETSVAKPKSVVVAYILWALGLIGIGGLHRLYTGRWITGILWLLTFGLFYVGTIIDFVMIFIWHKKGCLGKSSSKCHSAGNNHKKSEDKKSDHFNALTPLLTEKIVKLAQEEIGELDASPFKNTYLLTKIPAVEVALAKKQIAPGLHSEEKILFLWGTKKLKNGYLLTDHRLFYRYASKKGVANWSDVSSVMFKTRIGSHALFVDGKAVAYEQDQNRMPARLKDYLNRYFYRVVTEVFERDTDQVPPVDFEEKELKAQKRAEVAGKIIGGAIAGTVAIAGAALSDKCEHSPIGKHAYVYGQCRYCGKKKPQGPLNI